MLRIRHQAPATPIALHVQALRERSQSVRTQITGRSQILQVLLLQLVLQYPRRTLKTHHRSSHTPKSGPPATVEVCLSIKTYTTSSLTKAPRFFVNLHLPTPRPPIRESRLTEHQATTLRTTTRKHTLLHPKNRHTWVRARSCMSRKGARM